MKKLLVVLVLVLMGTMSYAQWGTNVNDIYNTNTGKVGIGAGASFVPAYNLDVAKNMTSPTIAVRNLGGGGGAQFLMFDQVANADWRFKTTALGAFKIRDQKSSIDLITIEKGAAANCIYIIAGGNMGFGTATPTAKMDVNGTAKFSGNVGIGVGTTAPSANLAVNGTGTFNGKVKATEIEVLLAAWPDHVFKPGFQLMPLQDVENFISLNKHLPGVPSETEVIQNGNNLGEMDAVLMQKIEELTLYVIQLKKENDEIKSKLSGLLK